MICREANHGIWDEVTIGIRDFRLNRVGVCAVGFGVIHQNGEVATDNRCGAIISHEVSIYDLAAAVNGCGNLRYAGRQVGERRRC